MVYGRRKDIEERFPLNGKNTNVIVLKMDPHLETFKTVPIAQIYADSWNLSKWHADDFVKAADKKIGKLIGR